MSAQGNQRAAVGSCLAFLRLDRGRSARLATVERLRKHGGGRRMPPHLPERAGLPQVLGSSGYGHWQVRIVGWQEFLPKIGTESTIIDGATNLKEQISAAS